jgi:HAD superfamily hydrolase (TIGR01490 family)
VAAVSRGGGWRHLARRAPVGGRDGRGRGGPYTDAVEAAFFDLDKTVISRSSMMAFAGAFRREGLVSRRSLARGAWTQLIYVRWGAGPKKLARVQESVLALTTGWEQAAVRRIVAAGLGDAIDPIVYDEALSLIREHRAAGRRVYLVSAAPEEIVEPIGRRLGVDEAIASRPDIDADGRYAGTVERYAYGPAKASIIRELARREDIDLEASWAYTDSVTDLPMLEAVGHPVAVNADRSLERISRMRGWEVVRFERRAGARGRSRRRRLVQLSAVTVMATTGGVGAWLVRRRDVSRS